MLTHQQAGYVLLGLLAVAVLVVLITYWHLYRMNKKFRIEQAKREAEYRKNAYPPNIHLVYESRVSKVLPKPWEKIGR